MNVFMIYICPSVDAPVLLFIYLFVKIDVRF